AEADPPEEGHACAADNRSQRDRRRRAEAGAAPLQGDLMGTALVIRRLRQPGREAGYTLIELLVSMTMGVVVMGAVAALMIVAVKDQPQISEKSQNISTARWVLERLTREIRNGIAVTPGMATASEVSFRTYVRTSSCDAGGPLASGSPAIECQVTYSCTTTS